METFNIIGIDPGNNLGISVFNLDLDYKIKFIKTHFYVLEDYGSTVSNDKKLAKLLFLQNIPSYLINMYQPVAVGVESAFMNSRFPTAVMSLSQYVSTIELAFKNNNPFIKLFKYPPKYIKKFINTGDANKKDMLSGIKKVKEIMDVFDPTGKTEHEIDATSIAYVLLNEIRNYPLVLCSI